MLIFIGLQKNIVMNYTQTYLKFKDWFKSSETKYDKELNIEITFENYKSKSYCTSNSGLFQQYDIFNGYNSLSAKNLNFSFPVITRKNNGSPKGVIILLHGLNERSWEKYIPWGIALAKATDKQVILFPISYHMNRSPEAWGDPRQMQAYVNARKNNIPKATNISVANIAMSERLTLNPEQFFLSGYQSVSELIQLTDLIRQGQLKSIHKNSKIDFFGYSIGAFLSELLAISNPEGRYANSRFFLFCGGATLDKFNANSKYIMDSIAFERIKQFYGKEYKFELNKKSLFSELMQSTYLGKTFEKLLNSRKIRKLTNNQKQILKNQITVVTLKQDKVITFSSIRKTLPYLHVELLDFDYKYTHEMPFPIFEPENQENVNIAFNTVFQKASEVLAG